MPKEVFVLGLVTLVGGFGIASTILREWIRSRRTHVAPPDQSLDQISRQLADLQQSLDATALEVERLGEGLRFTTKLLTERDRATDRPRSSERINTPH